MPSPAHNAITRDHIDDLLRFLPDFGGAGPDTVVERDEHASYPVYTPEVEEFVLIAGRSPWKGAYRHQETGAMFQDDDAIETATLDDIRSMLTFCVRAERFSEGFWAISIRTGRIGAILRRLAMLRESVG